MNHAVISHERTEHTTDTVHYELDEALGRRRLGKPVWQWFDRRIRTHHQAMEGLRGNPLKKEEANIRLHEQLATPGSGRPRVMYLHIPFCHHICSFCAFFRKPTGHETERYAAAMRQQIQSVADTPWAQQFPFQAVYFGGGTPTVLPAERLAELVQTIRQTLPLTPDCEITIETCFGGVDRTYLKHLHEAGVNRLSFGLQTFDTAIRQSLGRRSDLPAILEVLETAESIGFRSTCVDLIYNLPEQSGSSWREDLRILETTPVTGVSVYALIPFPGSTLVKTIAAGRHEPLGGPDAEYYYFNLASQMLSNRSSWQRMTPFHFGQSTRETCLYNASRAGHTDILGLGCGAGGGLNSLMYMHEMDIAKYCEGFSTGTMIPIAAANERSSDSLPRMATLELLDDRGIDENRLSSLVPNLNPMMEKLRELDLIERRGTHLRLTSNGCFWAYTITSFITETIARSTVDRTH